jgi:hypothetical protein
VEIHAAFLSPYFSICAVYSVFTAGALSKECHALARTSAFCTVTALSNFALPMNQFSANNEIADLMHPPYCSAV